MKIRALLIMVLILVTAASAPGYEIDEHKARGVVHQLLDRALAVGSEDLIPKTALLDASIGEVFPVHDPKSLQPIYCLIPIRSASSDVIGVVAVDAQSHRWLWYTFSYSGDTFPPVSVEEARLKVGVRARELGVDGKIGQPTLIRAYDKHLYWRFESTTGETWLVNSGRPNARVMSSFDDSARKALFRRQSAIDSEEMKFGMSYHPPTAVAENLMSGALLPSYNIPAIPYHFQITDWYCGPASLQMVMDYLGEEIGQHNIADVANDIVDQGCFASDMRRSAHFSGMSVAIQDSMLQGYTERPLGYGCVDYYWGYSDSAARYQDLKTLVSTHYPVYVLTWYDGSHDTGHFRIVKGFDDSLDVFVIHDPWYYGGMSGPNLLINQEFFVTDLWEYSWWWGMIVRPWLLAVNAPPSVAQGDTFSVDLTVYYPGPYPFAGKYSCSSCEANIALSPGLTLAGGSSNIALPVLSSGDSTTVSWEVVAVGPPGQWGMAFQAQGILEASSASYPSYSDSIGGHAYETISITGALLAEWDGETRLTNDSGSSETCQPGARALVIEDDGTVHVVWADTRDGDSEIYYRSRSGGTWGPEIRLTTSPGLSHSACIALGLDGRLHVAWVDTRDGNQEIYYKCWDPVGGWSSDERVTNYYEVDCNPSIAAGDTAIYVAWESREGGSYRVAAVYFSERTSLGWSARMDVDNSPARDSYKPSLAYGVNGLLHIVYERQTANSPNEKEKIVHKSWNGTSWSARTGLSTNISYSRDPVVAVGNDSTVHVVWQDGENIGGDIFYAWYDGSSWQPTQQIVTGGTEASMPSIAVDGTGSLYVVWVDHRHGESEIYLMSKDESGWGAETRLTTAADASELPTVAATQLGEVCVVWTDLRHGNAEIYFNGTGESSGAPDTPVVPAVEVPLYLSRPYPLPFTDETHFRLSVGVPTEVCVEVFDVRGHLVKTLGRRMYDAGTHYLLWDGTGGRGQSVAPGVYFIRCGTSSSQQVRRALLVR